MFYSEDDYLPISGLVHLAYCPRRCALVHLEKIWAENYFTASGRVMHDRVHNAPSESRGDVRTARGLALRSRQLGLTGVADVVEFHRVGPDTPDDPFTAPRETESAPEETENRNSGPTAPESIPDNTPPNRAGVAPDSGNTPTAVRLPKRRGLWRPYPVEYKRGNPKKGNDDAVQLCAQAICLEESLGCAIAEGALFYGQTRRRETVIFDDQLRQTTERLARRFHDLIDSGQTPPPDVGPKCKACSLADECLPDMKKSAVTYLQRNWEEAGQ